MVSSLFLAMVEFSLSAKALPIKAIILSGQSNMVGHGFYTLDPMRNGGQGSLEEAVKRGKFGQLMDKDGKWRVRDDVWIDYFDHKGKLTVGFGAGEDCIGPEFGFGQVVGDTFEDPVLLIKIAWGGKSLAVDFRPPSSGGEVGPSYRELIRLSREALSQAGTNFQYLKGRSVELVGFGWHQGWNDRVNGKFVDEYQVNMANFIRDVRKDLSAPRLPFVIADTGMGGFEEKNERALALIGAQAAVAEYPEFKGNVAYVSTRSFWRTEEQSPSNQSYHWNNNGETYYLIGEGMGRSMIDLIMRKNK